MGYIVHHAIIVTCWDSAEADLAHKQAVEEFGAEQVTPILGPAMNGYCTFLVGPDGSKEGWDLSETGDARRNRFVAYLDRQRYDDGSTSLAWAEVQYGDEMGDDRLLRTHRHPLGFDGERP